jgi:hypothetical protein
LHDLFEDQLEPVEFSINLRPDISSQNAPVARSKLLEPFPSVTA